jgi:TRAP-type transport system periplasmic protein
MRGRTSVFVATIFTAFLFAFTLVPYPASAAPIKLNYANFPPAPTFPCVQMERWKVEVEKRTNGQVEIKTFPGGTLLDAKNMMDGVISGMADIGCLSTAYQPGRFPVINATSLPLGFKNATQASLTIWDLYSKYQPEELSKVKVLAMFASAPANIYAKVPVKNLDDLRGLQLRASGGVAEVLKVLGATPVGMPQSEAPEALQKGVVKGAASSLETLMDFKYAELCKYVTIFNGPIYPFTVVMNLNKWNSLPKDVQKVMEDLGREQSEWTGKYMDEHVKKSIDWSKENHQIEITELSAEEQAKWDAMLEPLVAKWAEEARSKGLPDEAILKDIKAFSKQY